MKISNLNFTNEIFLAPMAGVTNTAFREICVENGCGLTYTEMVSAKGMYYGSENTEALINVSPKEKPMAIQIFGKDPDIMANVCYEYINNNDELCLIDINMGCPVPKIVKNGEGSALMKDVKLAARIVKNIKKVSTKPVTVKCRIGFDDEHINVVEFAKEIEAAGADCLTVHGRTRKQMYEGKANWEIIREVKENISIPLIANGDVFTVEDAVKIKQITNCDGIMIARGSKGNPWIFNQIKQMINNEEITYPSQSEKIETCIKQYKLAVKYSGEYKAVREMRKQIAWYLKGMKNSTDLKNEVNKLDNAEAVIEELLKYKDNIRKYEQ